jgi:hypothetical protein
MLMFLDWLSIIGFRRGCCQWWWTILQFRIFKRGWRWHGWYAVHLHPGKLYLTCTRGLFRMVLRKLIEFGDNWMSKSMFFMVCSVILYFLNKFAYNNKFYIIELVSFILCNLCFKVSGKKWKSFQAKMAPFTFFNMAVVIGLFSN